MADKGGCEAPNFHLGEPTLTKPLFFFLGIAALVQSKQISCKSSM